MFQMGSVLVLLDGLKFDSANTICYSSTVASDMLFNWLYEFKRRFVIKIIWFYGVLSVYSAFSLGQNQISSLIPKRVIQFYP